MPVRRIDLGITDIAPVVEQGRTSSRLRFGEKRQSVVKLTSRNRALARASARLRLPPYSRAGSK
jgi:hypothetical protein